MNAAKTESKGLGAFLGVFTPTILTILGVIMFMRVGWLVGTAGLVGTMVIVVMANAITFLTSLSVSSLATNMRVGVGGAYFIISRSLGVEIGGAVGIPLYLSQVLSITLYSYGLAESLNSLFDWIPVTITAAVIVVGVTAVASKSTELTLKLQLPVMVLIFAAIASLLLGADFGDPQVPMWGSFTDNAGDVGFWGAFAVFFPAVTGILAGVSLSGDLKDPGSAIPRGVMAAVAVGFVVYLIIPIALASSASQADLLTDSLIWTKVAAVGFLVMPGLWGAILSSAFGSALGAPRTLQALAMDRLVPEHLGRIDEESGEPLVGLYLSGALALVAVFLGDLNTVAEWVTIFFLTTYGALNAVAVVEILVADPSYRPRILIPWWAAGLGAIGCFVAMFAINPVACGVAIFIEAVIFFLFRRRAIETEWGDARNGLILSLAHALVVWFTDAKKDARNWRPQVLVMTRNLDKDMPTVNLAGQMGSRQGILTVAELREQPLEEIEAPVAEIERNRQELREHGIDAFYEMVAIPEIDDGVVLGVAQAHGFGGMNANTVMFQWDDDRVESLSRHLRYSRELGRLDKCVLIYHPSRETWRERKPGTARVVVWWSGLQANGDLMLLLAWMLSRGTQMHGADIVLRTVASDDSEAAQWRENAASLSERVRIPMKLEPIVRQSNDSAYDVIVENSAGADLVVLGLANYDKAEEADAAERLAGLVTRLPSTLLVRNSGPFRGRLM